MLSKCTSLLLGVILLSVFPSLVFGQADVIKAAGGTNLSIDSVNVQNGYTTFDTLAIRETESGQLDANQSIVLTLPTGFEWNPNLAIQSNGGTIDVIITATGSNNTELEVEFDPNNSNSSQVTFNVTSESRTTGSGQGQGKGKGPGRVEISGLQLKPTTTEVPTTGQISNTGSTGPDKNYGDLSTAVGSIQTVEVETKADGTGQVVPAQDLLAGESITVYSIGRDVGDNFVKNVALASESAWTLTGGNGQVPLSALTASASLKNATLSSQTTGTTEIQANYGGASSVNSGLITVQPREADEMVINTQPSSSATAGETFSTQPEIFLEDQFGNKVTTDNSTQVTASISSGNGTLSGTLTQSASNGEVNFTDLYTTTADTINIQFQSSGLSAVTSNQVIVNPAATSDLEYIQQPTNIAQNSTISPPVELQLLDEFGNNVKTSGTTVSINNETFLKNSSTLSVSTNGEGKATFSDLNITNNATLGERTITAQFSGISSAVESESFQIVSADDLARYVITNTNGNDIGEQQAGTSFDITITAKQGDGDDFTFSSDSTLTITADNTIQSGSFNVTIPNGSSSVTTSITLTSTGTGKIFADKGETISGESNSFNVIPSDNISTSLSTISTDPTEITADGSSTSTITVQLKDEFGNNLESGGETVELSTTAGTLNNTTANNEGDGTYTAVLTSSTDATETATITGSVNNSSISDDATVDFVAGGVVGFRFTLPSGDQTAGISFNIDVDAIDADSNTVTSFDGPVTFTSNSTISSGTSGSFSNGELTQSITLTKADSNATITATADDLFNVSSTSSSFIVNPSDPDANTSQLTASPVVLENVNGQKSTISVILRDQYQNQIFQPETVSLSVTQLEEDNSTSPDGNTEATFTNGQDNISINSPNNNGIYRATLSATGTVELVEISATFGSSPSTTINQSPTVDIVIPNKWEPGGGPSEFRSDWNNDSNWSRGIPDPQDFVIIPDNSDPVPDLDLNVELGSFRIGSGNALTLFGGNSIDVSGNLEVNSSGNLNIEQNTELTVGGNLVGGGTFSGQDGATIKIKGSIDLTNFRTLTTNSQVTLNGANPQTISTPIFTAQNLNIENDVNFDADSEIIETNVLSIGEGYTMELNQGANDTLDVFQSIEGEGKLIINDNTFVLGGNIDLNEIDASQGTVVFGVRPGFDPTNFNLPQQQVDNLSQIKNAIINNDEGVKTFEDIIVDGDLTLENGELIISSGKSLIAPNQTYKNGSIKLLRSINTPQSWIMLSSPINTSFDNLLNGLTTQGISGSRYPDRQPNLLYYNETIEGTDNQRWRTPDNVSDAIQDPDSTGRGFYFYVFGDVSGDTDYNATLPVTLSVSGQEYQYQSSTFNFSSVTYTAAADTGWNLVGNPWASTIDWDDNNWTKTNMDNTIYIWDPGTNSYKTWNGIDGSLGDGLIKPFQGFWVKANAASPELTIDKSAKTTGGQYYGKSKRKPASIGFKLTADSLESQMHITLSPDGKQSKDARDAYRLLPFNTNTYLEFYSTLKDGTQLDINNLARSFGKEISIPIHIGGFVNGTPLNGEYTISWPDFGKVPDAWTLILKDKKTGQKIDLRKNTFYTFNHSQSQEKVAIKNTIKNFKLTENLQAQNKAKSSSESRFVLQIKPGADAAGIPDEYSLGINYPNPFSERTTIKYNTPVEGNVQILIYDVLGRKVKTLLDERRPAAFHEIDWNPKQLASGVYICVMRAGDKQFTKKLTFIK